LRGGARQPSLVDCTIGGLSRIATVLWSATPREDAVKEFFESVIPAVVGAQQVANDDGE